MASFSAQFHGVLSPYDASSDVGSSQEEEHAITGSSTVSSMTEDGPVEAVVVRCRGLPYTAQPEDVRAFFHPNELQDICFCRRDGRPTGEAYVVLSPSSDAQACFAQLDKKYMGNRYVELFEASAADLRAVKKMLEDRSMQGFVVRLRGLPYTAKAADVRAFLDGIQLSASADNIVLAHAPNGRPTGEAYVELADEQALTLAMTRHKEVMGERYIEVFNSSKMDKLQAQKQLEALSRQSLDHAGFLPAVPLPYGNTAGVQRGFTAVPQLQLQQQQQQQQQQHYPVPQLQQQQQHYPVHLQLQPYPPAPLSAGASPVSLANSLAQCHLTPNTSPHRGSPLRAGAAATGPNNLHFAAGACSLGLSAGAEPLRSLHQSPVLLPTAVSAASLSPPGLQLPAAGGQHSLLQQPGGLMVQPDVLLQRAAAYLPTTAGTARAACLPAAAGLSAAACMPAGAPAVGSTGVTMAQLLPMQGLMQLPGGAAAAAAAPARVGLNASSAYLQLQQQQQLNGQVLLPGVGASVAPHGMSGCLPVGGLQLPYAQPMVTPVTAAATVQQQQQLAMAGWGGTSMPLQLWN